MSSRCRSRTWLAPQDSTTDVLGLVPGLVGLARSIVAALDLVGVEEHGGLAGPLAGGPVGLALTAAFFGGQAYLNHRRRRAAEADAVEKWRHLAGARLTVSTHGIYLGTGEGILPISYADVQEVQLTAPGEVVMAASNANGSARWKLRGQWAELIHVLWAARYMPDHPQVLGRTWLPADWFVHAAAHGYDVDTSRWPRWNPNTLR